jgi:hypothetical protein
MHEFFAALAATLHAHGFSDWQIFAVVMLLALIINLVRRVYRRRNAPLVKPIVDIADDRTPRSLIGQLHLFRFGPDWDVVASRVKKSAYFIVTSDGGDKSPSKRSLFHVHGDPRSYYEMREASKRRIHVFFCQGIRPLIPWIDYMYLRLLDELAEAGAKVLILSHNDQFYRDSEGELRPVHIRSNSDGFTQWTTNLQRLFGPGFTRRLHLGKEYIVRNRRLMEGYIKFIYDDVTSLYASDQMKHRAPDHVPNANEFANVIDSFACSSLLSPGAFVLYLGWERQTAKWTQGTLRELSKKLSDGFVVGDTITKEMGHRVDVYSSDHVLNLFDADEEMARKLFGRIADGDGANIFLTDLITVKNICVGPARLDMQIWDYSTMTANLSRHDLQGKLNECRDILRPYVHLLTDALRSFVGSDQLVSEMDTSVGEQVCPRCAAYTSVRKLRDSGKRP